MSTTYSLGGASTPRTKLGSSVLSQSSAIFRGSHTRLRKKKKIATATISKRGQYRVIDSNNVDRTPKLLYNPEYQVLEEWQPTALDYVDADLVSTGSQISLQKSIHQSVTTYGSRHPNSVSLQMSFSNITNADSYKEHTKLTLDADLASEVRSDELASEKAPSQFRLKSLPSREFFPPHSRVAILVKETDSFTLFSMGSVVISSESEDLEYVKSRNQKYEFITVGEGRFTRKLNTAEQQTVERITTSQSTLAPKKPTANSSTWVTVWKIFDEYSGVTKEKKDIQAISIEDQWIQLLDDEKFFSQGLIMERIIGAPNYREPQLNYKEFIRMDPMSLDVQFTYSTEILWIYESAFVQKKPVTAIAINPHFPDIIAVGHGKFLYSEADYGFICIWCVKNPKHPERFYRFKSSVLCLDFSIWRPNHLAVGFLNGQYRILDISSAEKKVMYSKDSVACGTYESVMYTKWWVCKDIFDKEEERTMITTGDGKIIQFRIRMDKLSHFQMMRITKMEGKLKGIDCLKTCEAEEIPMIRFPAARCVVRYPNDNQFYLVAGDDGSVHKCSTNFYTQHVDSFLAHSGPVYALKFSPVCNKIFLTCGADGAIRLWLWDLFEPLITLTVGPSPVEDAAWSPKNSTIIVSISECNFYMWDLRRKAHHPASILAHPQNLKFCSLQFTKTGDNIMLGDVEGSIYVMALHGMPFEEQFKEEVLASSIMKELIVKPKLLKMVKKSGLAYRESLFG